MFSPMFFLSLSYSKIQTIMFIIFYSVKVNMYVCIFRKHTLANM